MSLRFWRALFLFLGTIIGVGIFALPYITSQSGFFLVLGYFILLGALAIGVHLIFAHICLATPTKHRFPGYVYRHLGRKWGHLALFSNVLGLFGAQLAYLLVGGGFLYKFFNPYLGGKEFWYIFAFFAIGSFLIFKGAKSVSLSEFFINLFFFGLLFYFFVHFHPKINFSNFLYTNLSKFFYPYGVVLFSLWGSAIIPEIKELLQGDQKTLKRVIISGIILSIVVYLLFVILIFGVTGKVTTKDALSGLIEVFGPKVVHLAYVFGIITCFTSYLALGLTLKKIFWLDAKLPKNFSFWLAVLIPFLFYLLGLKNFVIVISLVGAISIGFEGCLDVIMYRKVFTDKLSFWKKFALYSIPFFLVIGVIFEIVFSLK